MFNCFDVAYSQKQMQIICLHFFSMDSWGYHDMNRADYEEKRYLQIYKKKLILSMFGFAEKALLALMARRC